MIIINIEVRELKPTPRLSRGVQERNREEDDRSEVVGRGGDSDDAGEPSRKRARVGSDTTSNPESSRKTATTTTLGLFPDTTVRMCPSKSSAPDPVLDDAAGLGDDVSRERRPRDRLSGAGRRSRLRRRRIFVHGRRGRRRGFIDTSPSEISPSDVFPSD